jgi:hypothetical protein
MAVSSDAIGDVPGLQSVDTAMAICNSRSRSIGGSRVSRK